MPVPHTPERERSVAARCDCDPFSFPIAPCQAESLPVPVLLRRSKRTGFHPAFTSRKARYKTVRIEAEINLETSATAKPRWQAVILILSAPKDGIHDNWVIFLATDTDASVEQILEIYALRWSIEVYFKEVKQNFGFLAEQSGKYQVAYASIHLAAVRYLIIFEAMQRNGNISFGEQRDLQTGKL